MSQNKFKLFMPCPKCAKKYKDFQLEHWFHGGTCNGLLYIDENAYVHCQKCGKTAHITKMRMTCDRGYHVKNIPTKGEIASAISVGAIGVVNDSLKWFKHILEHIKLA